MWPACFCPLESFFDIKQCNSTLPSSIRGEPSVRNYRGRVQNDRVNALYTMRVNNKLKNIEIPHMLSIRVVFLTIIQCNSTRPSSKRRNNSQKWPPEGSKWPRECTLQHELQTNNLKNIEIPHMLSIRVVFLTIICVLTKISATGSVKRFGRPLSKHWARFASAVARLFLPVVF